MHVVATSSPVTVQLLAPLQVRGRGAVLGAKDLGGGKPRQIFEILVLEAGRTVTKNRLAELIWPHRAPADMIGTLESYVSVLRHHLLPVCGSRTALIRTGVGGYVVAADAVEVDVRTAELLAVQALGDSPWPAHQQLQEAVAHADGAFLAEDEDARWAVDARATHARRLADLLVRAAWAADEVGEVDAALHCANRALGADPLNEVAWEARLTALLHAGRQAEALEAYGVCRQTFERELGCAPGEALQALFRRILDGSVERDDELGVLVSALLEVRHHAGAARLVSVAGARAGTHVPGMSVRVRDACRILDDLVTRALGAPALERPGAS